MCDDMEKSAEETQAKPETAADAKVEKSVEELTAELEKAKKEIRDLTEEAARARADFYNFRTRVERDRERDRKLAAEKSIEALLPVFENLERICGAVEDTEGSLYKGMTMVTKQFMDAMGRLGLEPIPTDGEFDPSLHEAVSMEPIDDESKDGHIIGALRKGYKLAGRVIRAPQVRVGKYTK